MRSYIRYSHRWGSYTIRNKFDVLFVGLILSLFLFAGFSLRGASAAGVAPAPTVTDPSAPVTVNVDNYTIKGTTGNSSAGAMVRIYKDVNNNGNIDSPADTVVASTTSIISNNFSVPVSLDLGANNFLATFDQSPSKSESGPVNVPTITYAVVDDTPVIPDCGSGDTTFDTFAIGSVNGQHGWSVTNPNFDQAVVDNIYGYDSLGCKSLRLSNSYTTGSFGDQTFSYSTANEAGEADSTSGGKSGGTRQNHYVAQFDIASTQAAEQSGLAISVSPDRGDGSRMSYLRFADTPGGIDVFFDDVQGTSNPANFVETNVGTLSRSEPHTIKFVIDYLDGPSNDIVRVYIDGSLVHTGTTWENYYRYDSESSAEQTPRTTDSLLFRSAGTAVPANSGKGFLFDNVDIATSTRSVDTSSTTFVNDPKYVRANNGGDLAAQIVTPDSTEDVRFYVDGDTSTAFPGSNIGGAGATTSWWRLYTPLAAGEHTISAQIKVDGIWYDVADTGTVYSIDLPWAEYVIPQANQYFRPNDKVVRVKADDEFNQFDRMVTVVNSVSHTVNRADCTDQGSYVLCDLQDLNLPEGTYQAKTTTYTKANNRVDNLMSPSFTIDSTRPELSNFQITEVHSVYGASVSVSADATDANGIKSVEFYITAPRAGDGVCDGNGTKLATATDTTAAGNTYAAILDTSGLNGEYCLNAIAGDVAANHSSILKIKATFDNTAPSTPVNGLPNGTYEPDNEFDFTWDDSTDNIGPITYEYQATQNPAQSGGVLTTSLWQSGILNDNMIHSSGAPDGVWYWQVRAKDAAGNYSAWSEIWSMTIDSIAPAVPTHLSPSDGAFKTTSNQTLIDWSDVSDASPVTYKYQSSLSSDTNPDGSFTSPAYTSGALSDSEIPTPGTPEGKYYWHVKAIDAAGHESGWSSPWTVIVDNTGPDEPVPSLAAGDYTGPQSVELSSSDSLSGVDKIYYTTDGNTPDNSSNEYTAAISIPLDTTLKAIAYDKSGNASSVMTAEYGIAPVISGEGSIGVTTTSITLIWDTDHPSTSRVIYDTVPHPGTPDPGSAPNYGYAFSTVEDSTKVTSHSVTINGLTPGQTYYFRTVSHGSPESVSGEVVAITKVASSTNSGGGNSNSNSGNDDDNGGIPVFRIFTAGNNAGQTTNNADGDGNVLSDNDDSDNGQNGNGDVKSVASGISSASTKAADSSVYKWGGLILLILLLLLAYDQYRRRRNKAHNA